MNSKVRIRFGDWEAVISPAKGANCIGLKNDRLGISILREPPETESLDNPYLYGMPILFPVNRIEGGCFEFEGRKYTFPINEPKTGCHLHGELHQMQFCIDRWSESLVRCRYSAEKGEYLSFPHAFEIIQEYRLQEDEFYHIVEVINRSAENMPVFLGFHTTFNTLFHCGSKGDDIRVFANITEEYERNMEVNYLPTGNKPDFDNVSTALSEGCYKPFEGKASRHYRGNGVMTLTDTRQKMRVVYENDPQYKFRLIFNGGDEGYICLEPQTCLANCQNSPFPRAEAGFDFLKPGECRTFISKIKLEFF